MACIFPSALIADIRKAHATGQPLSKREIRFPGVFLGSPTTVPGPQEQQVGKTTVPVWCSSCGEPFPPDSLAIQFVYDFYPQDQRSAPTEHYLHIEKCKHAGGIP